MSPLRAFYNRDHPKPPHEDNPADSRIGDYRSRPVVTRELPDEPDNFQMSLALVFISLGRVVISPGGVGLRIPRKGRHRDSLILTHNKFTCGRDHGGRALSPRILVSPRAFSQPRTLGPRPRNYSGKGAPLSFPSC